MAAVVTCKAPVSDTANAVLTPVAVWAESVKLSELPLTKSTCVCAINPLVLISATTKCAMQIAEKIAPTVPTIVLVVRANNVWQGFAKILPRPVETENAMLARIARPVPKTALALLVKFAKTMPVFQAPPRVGMVNVTRPEERTVLPVQGIVLVRQEPSAVLISVWQIPLAETISAMPGKTVPLVREIVLVLAELPAKMVVVTFRPTHVVTEHATPTKHAVPVPKIVDVPKDNDATRDRVCPKTNEIPAVMAYVTSMWEKTVQRVRLIVAVRPNMFVSWEFANASAHNVRLSSR